MDHRKQPGKSLTSPTQTVPLRRGQTETVSVFQGDTLVLTAEGVEPGVEIEWLLNGQLLERRMQPWLVINYFEDSDLVSCMVDGALHGEALLTRNRTPNKMCTGCWHHNHAHAKKCTNCELALPAHGRLHAPRKRKLSDPMVGNSSISLDMC
jgi:hypothetical protein